MSKKLLFLKVIAILRESLNLKRIRFPSNAWIVLVPVIHLPPVPLLTDAEIRKSCKEITLKSTFKCLGKSAHWTNWRLFPGPPQFLREVLRNVLERDSKLKEK